jgi:alpha-L-fucosidase 2
MVDISRRHALLGGAATAFVAGCQSMPSVPFINPLDTTNLWTLWYREPAAEWVQALPVGNGRLGAMIFGGTSVERLQLNEDTLWSGGPYEANNAQSREALPEIRRLIFAGRHKEASDLAASTMLGQPIRQMPYQPLGDLMLTFPEISGEFEDYQRSLNLDEAVARTRFTSNDIEYTREIFASPVDQVIVVKLASSERRKLAFNVTLNTPHKAKVTTTDNTLIVRGVNGEANGIAGALKFEARAIVLAKGGSAADQEGMISVRNADSAILLIAAATSFKSYKDVSGNPTSIVQRQLTAARAKPYERLFQSHIAEHRRLFHRVAIDLGITADIEKPTNERIRDSLTSEDTHLAALYFQFGRYLLISSSRPGCQPANLQGIWNDSIKPPWGSKWTININTQMNYWPAEPTALGECVEPLIAMVKDIAERGAHTAQVQYGARGWVTHHNTDLWRATAPIDGVKSGIWPTGGAWLCNHLWDRYDYSHDRRYLSDIYPILKGASQFFLDTLVEEPGRRWLVTCPSLSPENNHVKGVALCAGPTMDQQIIRDLFSHTIEAAEILNIDASFREEVIKARGRLAPHQIGGAGQLQEWLDDWDMQAPEIHHRHVSHLYGVYPSGQINLRDTPALAVGARRSLEIRGDEATGWGIGWRLNLWARLQDAEHADKVLRMLLGPDRTYPNMFDAHPPFQIDGNFGGVAGIAEMLMQSYGGSVYLLPALPKRFATGSVRGLRARGGFEIDLKWSGGRLDTGTVHNPIGGQTVLRYKNSELQVRLRPGSKIQVRTDGPDETLIIL